MSFYSGYGEMERKSQHAQQTHGSRLPRMDYLSHSHQPTTKGMSHGDPRTQASVAHQRHSHSHQQMTKDMSHFDPRTQTSFTHQQTRNQGRVDQSLPFESSSRAKAEPRGSSSYGNRTASRGYSRNQKVLLGVRDLLSNNRQLLYKSEAEQTIKEFDGRFDELMSMASDQDSVTDTGKKHLEDKLRKADETIDELSRELMSHKLSATMNTQLSADETAIENVSIKSRPLNIATEFSTLCSSEWHAAKEQLDKMVTGHYEEDAKLRFLSVIMELAEEEAQKLKNELFKGLDRALSQPITWAAKGEFHHSAPGIEVSAGLKNALSDHLRVSSEKIDMTELCEQIKTCIERKYGGKYNYIDFLHGKAAQAYIKGCASLAWKMVIQRPPMTFDVRDGVKRRFDPTTQELHWGASDPAKTGALVQFYVHPILKHGDKVMVKGRVWTK